MLATSVCSLPATILLAVHSNVNSNEAILEFKTNSDPSMTFSPVKSVHTYVGSGLPSALQINTDPVSYFVLRGVMKVSRTETKWHYNSSLKQIMKCQHNCNVMYYGATVMVPILLLSEPQNISVIYKKICSFTLKLLYGNT